MIVWWWRAVEKEIAPRASDVDLVKGGALVAGWRQSGRSQRPGAVSNDRPDDGNDGAHCKIRLQVDGWRRVSRGIENSHHRDSHDSRRNGAHQVSRERVSAAIAPSAIDI